MRIVSDNSPEDLRRRLADQRLGLVLRALAVNMLRVIRGAGKAYRLAHELADCSKALAEYADAFGHYPPPDRIERMLDPERPWPDQGEDRERNLDGWSRDLREDEALVREKQDARMEMRLAALQITASMLASQPLQQSRGDGDLREAIARHERLTAELRAYRAKEQRSGSAVRKAEQGRLIAAALAQSTKGPKGCRAPARLERPATAPPPPMPHDRLQPPSYDRLRVFDLTAEIREEFGVASGMDLVLWLNRLRRERGVAPLPQGQFPSTRATLNYVVKELRKERARSS